MKKILSFIFNPLKVSHYLYTVNLNEEKYPTNFIIIIIDTNDGEDMALSLVKDRIRKKFNKEPERVDIKLIEKY